MRQLGYMEKYGRMSQKDEGNLYRHYLSTWTVNHKNIIVNIKCDGNEISVQKGIEILELV